MLALALLLLQSLLHGHLSGLVEYDDGVYFGSSLQLIHGLLPYRDFVLIQPPMVTVLLTPFAALSLLTGTAHALEAARIFTDVVAVANVAMVGLLVRRRSTSQVLVSTATMAVYPAAVRSAQTVLLEPILVSLCLAGLLCLFEGDRISPSQRRIVIGGVLFGVAGATKLWAVFPFVAVLAVAWRQGFRTLAGWVAGGAAGFIACSLPFFVNAPAAFVHQVFVTQAVRNAGGYSSWERLADLTGFPGLYSAVSTSGDGGVPLLCVALAAVLVLCGLAFAGRRGRPVEPFERFVLLASVVTAAALFLAPVYYYHYAGFAAPFVAMLYGVVIARLRRRVAGGSAPGVWSGRARRLGLAAGSAALLALLCATVWVRVDAITTAAPPRQPAAVVGDRIPARGCVLFTAPAMAILDDRFTADRAGCSNVIDWLGQERVLDHGLSQAPSDARNRAVQARWLRSMRVSVAMVIGRYPEWGPTVERYVRRHFRLVGGTRARVTIYVRDT